MVYTTLSDIESLQGGENFLPDLLLLEKMFSVKNSGVNIVRPRSLISILQIGLGVYKCTDSSAQDL